MTQEEMINKIGKLNIRRRQYLLYADAIESGERGNNTPRIVNGILADVAKIEKQLDNLFNKLDAIREKGV